MSNPVRIGIAGLGRAGWGMHCRELRSRTDKFQIVAACDLEKDRRDAMAAEYGCKTYENVEELIADPDVELVDIATRSTDHFRDAMRALEAGKLVFVEKPMCLTYDEALKLKEASDNGPGKLFVRHNRRFEPAFQHICEIIESGILGDVFEIKLRRGGYQRRDDWQTLKSCGGGQLLNWGPHIIDHALMFVESQVADMWSDLKRIAAVGDAEDHIKIVIKGRNGRVVDLEISGGAAMKEPEYLVFGSKGALRCSGNTIELRYLDPRVELAPRRADSGTPSRNGYGSPDNLVWVEEKIQASPKLGCDMTSIWDYLWDAIRNGKEFPVKLEQAVQVMWVISEVKKGTEFDN